MRSQNIQDSHPHPLMTDPTGQSPPASHLHAEFQDFDAFGEAVEGWDLDWQQLDRGRLKARLQQIQSGSTLLTRTGVSRQFYQRGATPPDVLTFGILRPGAGKIRWCGQTVTSEHLLAFRPGGEYESVSQPGFGAHTVSVSEAVLDRTARSLGLPRARRLLSGSSQALICAPGALAELGDRLRTVFGRAASEPSVLSETRFSRQVEVGIPTLILTVLNSGNEPGGKPSFSMRSRVAHKAVAVISERPDEPLTVQEICAAVGVSRRTLQYAFREQFDVTPKHYLQSVRLNGARRDLRRSDPTVKIADVANRWGFWHLGQFAADYRRHFGELPSETVS